ncbi:MAG TPA: pilus assembly protein [Chakrabartia sp.]|jgi:hypothetical protein|nr:pilus assembly protein [Chakrabartia sp.]
MKKTLMVRKRGLIRTFRKLAISCHGNAILEFALVLPLIVAVAGGGLELANYMVLRRRISDVAAQVADNASRMGEGSGLAAKQVREIDINDVFTGAAMQAGDINLETNGRIILSSLEVNPDNGQWIHWQRCYGQKSHNSSYGNEGAGATGTSFPGMGPADARVTAFKDNAVMFVEVAYTYVPVMPMKLMNFGDIVETSSFAVRDARDLATLLNPAPEATVSTCAMGAAAPKAAAAMAI